jgi:redox-sensitive bicupin YhaK (pirin superfamily)
VLEGETHHTDSLGSSQPIRPGQLNWMTAGCGIAHAEHTAPGAEGRLHGVQLWVALPDAHRDTDPSFVHLPELPVIARDGARLTLLAGTLEGHTVNVPAHAPLIALDLELPGTAPVPLELEPGWEYALLPVDGRVVLEDEVVAPGELLVLPAADGPVTVAGPPRGRALLIGGPPWDEPLVMWWNFVARDWERIEAARAAWEAGTLTPPVPGDVGAPLAAPPLVAKGATTDGKAG